MGLKEENVEFTGWANGGAALGKLADGRVVFSEGILPGERARISYMDKESRFIKGNLIRLIEKSPLRIEPRCPLYERCSRCCMQNLEYPDQLHAKREILIDHLTRIAGLKDASGLVQPVLPSPMEWNYARSLIAGLDGDGNICMMDRAGGPVKLEAWCPITAECINDALASFTFEPGSGIDALEFRADDTDGIQLILHGEADQPEDEMENDTEISVVYQGPLSSWVMAGVSTLRQTAAGVRLCASDTSPFLNNPAVLDVFCTQLLNLLPDPGGSVLLDVHCGTGFWSRWFGSRCREVRALMEDEALCEDFVYNLDELDNVSLYIGKIEEVLPGIEIPAHEWILIEGGNSGLSEPEITSLCSRNPEKILCLYTDPAILSRDLKRFLHCDLQVDAILPFDIAPQTASFGILTVLS